MKPFDFVIFPDESLPAPASEGIAENPFANYDDEKAALQLDAPPPGLKQKFAVHANVTDPIAEIRKLMDSVLFSDEAKEAEAEYHKAAEKWNSIRMSQSAARAKIEELFSLLPHADKVENAVGAFTKTKAGVPFKFQPLKKLGGKTLDSLPDENLIIQSERGVIFFFGGGGPHIGKLIGFSEKK
jgi:hypothetical protein